MKKKSILNVAIFTLLSSIAIVSLADQPPTYSNYETNIIPPSPTAYELGKYGQIPIGYFTGTPNISIPLSSFHSGDIELPVSLSYSSPGIKVNQFPTNVGLGWSLNVGGVITRIIKDEPDESSICLYPEKPLSEGTFYTPDKAEFMLNSVNDGVDTESDLFMFNFAGYTGKFMYTNEKKIVTIPYENLTIEPFSTETVDMGFKITTPNGYKYTFSAEETDRSISSVSGFLKDRTIGLPTSWYLTQIDSPTGNQIILGYEGLTYSYVSAESSNCKHTLTYANCPGGATCEQYNHLITNYDVTNHINSKKIVSITSNNPAYGRVELQYYTSSEINSAPNGYVVKEILVKDNENNIKQSFQFNYLQTSNSRLFLQEIQCLDPSRKYNFDYIDAGGLCPRLSHAQDHWGFYNGAPDNQSLLPQITDHDAFVNCPTYGDREAINDYAKKGLLSKITYPTKGYTTIEYETNQMPAEHTVCPGAANVNLFVHAEANEEERPTDIDNTYLISNAQEKVRLYLAVFKNACSQVGDPDKVKAIFTIKDKNTGAYASIYRKSTGTNPWILCSNPLLFTDNEVTNNEYYVDLQANVTYEASIHPMFFCLDASASFTYEHRPNPCHTEITNGIVGGSRVKKTIDYDPVSTKSNITRYYYNKFDGDFNNLNISSGDVEPLRYVTKRHSQVSCDSYGLDCEHYELSSNTILPLYNTGSSNIYYKYVTVSNGGDNFENGGEIHEFKINRDVQGNILKGEEPLLSAAVLTNTGWNNGFEVYSKIFSYIEGAVNPILEKSYDYFPDGRNRTENYEYSTSKNYNPVTSGPACYTCQASDISWYKRYIVCTANHRHIWWMPGKPFDHTNDSFCIAWGSNNEYREWYHPCHEKAVGDTVCFSDAIDHLNITEYKNISQWSYLKKLTETQHLNGGDLITTTSYDYNNEKHIQLSQKTNIDSKGNTVSEKYWYPQDFNNIENFEELIRNGIVNKPVKVENFNGQSQTGGEIIKYTNIGQSSEIEKYEADTFTPESAFNPNALTSKTTNYNTRLQNVYDPSSNKLVKQTGADGMVTTYVWGYNNSLPVAKIVSGSSIAISDTLKNAINNNGYCGTDAKGCVDGDIAFLRTQLSDYLTGNMVTIYTYKPLVGMTSQTDPNGKTTYYEYDDFGRLKVAKDDQGNVLKKFDYHYSSEN